jgi:hypothetical protein
MVGFLPRAINLGERAQGRVWAFQAISRTFLGSLTRISAFLLATLAGILIAPGGFDEHAPCLAAAGLGDAAADRSSARSLRGNKPDVTHQQAGRLGTAEVAGGSDAGRGSCRRRGGRAELRPPAEGPSSDHRGEVYDKAISFILSTQTAPDSPGHGLMGVFVEGLACQPSAMALRSVLAGGVGAAMPAAGRPADAGGHDGRIYASSDQIAQRFRGRVRNPYRRQVSGPRRFAPATRDTASQVEAGSDEENIVRAPVAG